MQFKDWGEGKFIQHLANNFPVKDSIIGIGDDCAVIPGELEVTWLVTHFHPEPDPKQGMWLASQAEVHAMMDISDGLDCDLIRLIKSSQNGAVIETSKIPISPILARVSLENGWDALQLALTGGEDYCLLCTVSADHIDIIQNSFQKTFGLSLFSIGRITSQSSQLIYNENGKAIQASYKNFDHFQ